MLIFSVDLCIMGNLMHIPDYPDEEVVSKLIAALLSLE